MFIRIHRQALESDFVTQHLAKWIDLIFGYKQTGQAAIDAINVFNPATYFGVDATKMADSVARNALETMIATYGQMPRQLFFRPHPSPKVTSTPPISSPSPLPKVSGLRWGKFVGSPESPKHEVVLEQEQKEVCASLHALPRGEVFGLPDKCSLLLQCSQLSTDVRWAAILSWGHPDAVIRIKSRRGMPAVNCLRWTSSDEVSSFVRKLGAF